MCHILYVEDEAAIREDMLEIFELEGIVASAAVDGQDAWEILQSRTFDLIVTDLNMPRMSGETLIQLVREHPELQQIPIAVITGYSKSTTLATLEKFDIENILTKPAGIDEVLSMIRRMTHVEVVLGNSNIPVGHL